MFDIVVELLSIKLSRYITHCLAALHSSNQAKVSHLKDCKPSAWWKEVKKLSGMTSASDGGEYIMKSLQNVDGIFSPSDLANAINDCFICPTRERLPLPTNFIPEGDSS